MDPRLQADVELIEPSEDDLRHEVEGGVKEFHALEALHQSAEELRQLHLRQQVAHAVMQSGSENQGLAIVSIQIEPFRVRVHAWIAVACRLHQIQGISGANGLSV